MPVHQYEASLYATPPSGGVRFIFALYPRVSFALLTPHRGYYMPPRHAARLLHSARFARPPTSNLSGGHSEIQKYIFLTLRIHERVFNNCI